MNKYNVLKYNLTLKLILIYYRPPNTAMVSSTTYSNSFFLDGQQQPQKEKPFIPSSNNDLFPTGQPMIGTSLYHDCFVPREITPVVPVVPCGNILLSNQKMTCDTTNKVNKNKIYTNNKIFIIVFIFLAQFFGF